MIYTHAAAALIAASIAATSAWQVQNWRYGAKETEREQQNLVEVQQAAAASIRWMDNTLDAQNAATARSVGLRRDRDSAYAELDRLRAQLFRTMPGASSTTGTCPNRADPARELLATCATELVEMGGIADRHASDALMLQQAWPK